MSVLPVKVGHEPGAVRIQPEAPHGVSQGQTLEGVAGIVGDLQGGPGSTVARMDQYMDGRGKDWLPAVWEHVVLAGSSLGPGERQVWLKRRDLILEQDRALARWTRSETKTIVYFGGHDWEAIKNLPTRDEYPERPWGMVLELRNDPGLHYVYVSPGDAASEEFLSYLLNMIPESEREGVRARIHPVGLNDLGEGSLGDKFLKNKDKLAEVSGIVAKIGGPALLLSHETFQKTWDVLAYFRNTLGNSLVETVYGPQPFFRDAPFNLSEKGGARDFVFNLMRRGQPTDKHWWFSYPSGYSQVVYDTKGIATAIVHLLEENPTSYPRKVVVKRVDGTSGDNMAVFDIPDRSAWADKTSAEKVNYFARRLVAGATNPLPMEHLSTDYAEWLAGISSKGAIVEEWMADVRKGYSPSVQVRMGGFEVPEPSAGAGGQVLSVHEQLLHGVVYLGARLGIPDWITGTAVYQAGRLLAEVLHMLGVRGASALDTLIEDMAMDQMPSPGVAGGSRKLALQVIGVDLNARRGGANFPTETALGLAGPGAVFDPILGAIRRPDGSYLAYETSDKTRLPWGLEGVGKEDFLRFANRGAGSRIRFNPETGEGAVFYMMGLPSIKGVIGVQYLASSLGQDPQGQSIGTVRRRLSELPRLMDWALGQFAVEQLTGLQYQSYPRYPTAFLNSFQVPEGGFSQTFSGIFPSLPSPNFAQGILNGEHGRGRAYWTIPIDVRDWLPEETYGIPREALEADFIKFLSKTESRKASLLFDTENPSNGGVIPHARGFTVVSGTGSSGDQNAFLKARYQALVKEMERYQREIQGSRGRRLKQQAGGH